MNLLSLVQKFCLRTGIPKPVTVFGSTNDQVLQAMNLLEEEINDLAARHAWQSLIKETTHTTLAAEDQGALSTLSAGFNYIRNQTMWDTTDDLPVLGPVSGEQWQALKATASTGPRYQFRIRGGNLLVNPTPTAGHTWKWEYATKYPILDVDGTTLKEFFTADTDTFLLPDSILLLGLRWRWMREKGLSYAELFQSYELQVKDAMGRDGGRPVLSMEGGSSDPRPGVFVPAGSWI
jgi:hypothetical protein